MDSRACRTLSSCSGEDESLSSVSDKAASCLRRSNVAANRCALKRRDDAFMTVCGIV